MNHPILTLHRRGFLHRAGGFALGAAGTLILGGCGGAESADQTVGAQVAAVPKATIGVASVDAVPLNFALNLAYLGAQFHGYAANGTGLASALTTGVGRQGGVVGARQVAFADASVARLATEVASDKLAHVTGLRGALADAAVAQPGFDFAAGAAAAGRAAGIGGGMDLFASDDDYLVGALLIEDGVAAAYRSLLGGLSGTASIQLVTAILADAIYHGGLVRTSLASRASTDPSLAASVAAACALLGWLDGSDLGDQSLAADGGSANLPGADGNPIPFARSTAQMLNVLYLTPNAVGGGGFVPYGINAARG